MNQMKTAPHGLVSARKKNIANRECMNISHSNHDVIFFINFKSGSVNKSQELKFSNPFK